MVHTSVRGKHSIPMRSRSARRPSDDGLASLEIEQSDALAVEVREASGRCDAHLNAVGGGLGARARICYLMTWGGGGTLDV